MVALECTGVAQQNACGAATGQDNIVGGLSNLVVDPYGIVVSVSERHCKFGPGLDYKAVNTLPYGFGKASLIVNT